MTYRKTKLLGGEGMKLDPIVLDKAKEITGARSDNHLGVTFLNRTGTTVKNWRSGKTLPDVLTLYELHALTGIAIESMCVDDAA